LAARLTKYWFGVVIGPATFMDTQKGPGVSGAKLNVLDVVVSAIVPLQEPFLNVIVTE
jgi:hypothetical protein